MVDHGFGHGELTSKGRKLPTEDDKEEIAKCISKVPGVLWSHIVHAQTNTARYDLIWEEKRKCNENDIKKCASDLGYEIKISKTTIKDKSFKNGRPGKHPKDE